jgi:hypothetical protein
VAWSGYIPTEPSGARSGSTATEPRGKVAARAAKLIVIWTMLAIYVRREPVARIAPRRGGSNAGPGQEFKGTPSRLGGPPGYCGSKSHASPPIGDEGLFQAASSDIGIVYPTSAQNYWQPLETNREFGSYERRASRFHGSVVKPPRLPLAPPQGMGWERAARTLRNSHAISRRRVIGYALD